MYDERADTDYIYVNERNGTIMSHIKKQKTKLFVPTTGIEPVIFAYDFLTRGSSTSATRYHCAKQAVDEEILAGQILCH